MAGAADYGLFVWRRDGLYVWDERLEGKTYKRPSAAEKAATERNARGEHGGMIIARPYSLMRGETAAQVDTYRRREASLFGENPPRRSNPKVVTLRENPGAARVSVVTTISTTALDLSYLHSQKSRWPYRHKFGKGVTVQLLSDGSVRLFRPDGKPLWKNFKDR